MQIYCRYFKLTQENNTIIFFTKIQYISSFIGKIDDIKIYNGALDASQVKALFEEK